MFYLAINFFLILLSISLSFQFTFPGVTLEAYAPKGLLVKIPEIEGIKLFAFHGNRNRPIDSAEPGEFNKDIINLKEAGWVYYNPDLKLDIGDKIYYWIFIQYKSGGKREDVREFEVKELLPISKLNDSCKISETIVLPKGNVCKGACILESYFDGPFENGLNWTSEHYIPAEPDYEFCSYQNSDGVRFVKQKNLYIKPIALKNASDVRGILNLRNGCTRKSDEKCYHYVPENGPFILPPVISAKIKSVIQFKYGKVEIKAKLPQGDWLYPEIYLQSTINPENKIWIAYSRGNKRLSPKYVYVNTFFDPIFLAEDEHFLKLDNEIGGSILFGGPVFNSEEPERSKYLSSVRRSPLFEYTSSYHIYSVVWSPEHIQLFCDGVIYGESHKNASSRFGDPVQVVLGVGVGGVNDFPDNYESANGIQKPWQNNERTQVKSFFTNRNSWLSTWKNDDYALKVEYVKIWAL